jgi:predicted AAA+ superfamily ATPase
VERYVQVLEDLLLGFRVGSFTKRARRHLVQHPKFYYADAGVFRSVRPKGPLDRPEEIGGACLEGLVAQHLRAWIAYSGEERSLSFWRTKSGVEVDFVIYGEGTFLGIEVKGSKSVYPKDVRPLRAFRQDYPQADVCLLHGGDERLVVDGVPCLPCSQFLRDLIPGRAAPLP